jgi:hypothetical protein
MTLLKGYGVPVFYLKGGYAGEGKRLHVFRCDNNQP